MEITDLIKERESVNVSDIYIYLYEDGPVVFDVSAVHLQYPCLVDGECIRVMEVL